MESEVISDAENAKLVAASDDADVAMDGGVKGRQVRQQCIGDVGIRRQIRWHLRAEVDFI